MKKNQIWPFQEEELKMATQLTGPVMPIKTVSVNFLMLWLVPHTLHVEIISHILNI